MSTGTAATVEGPSLNNSSQTFSPGSIPEELDKHRVDSPDPLTALQDETLKVAMGVNTIRALQSLDAEEVQNKANKEYIASNMELWRKNWGLPEPPTTTKDEDVAGHTVRVDSDDKHYHWHIPAAVTPTPTTPVEPSNPPVVVTPPTPTNPPTTTPTTPATQPGTISKALPWIVAGVVGLGSLGLGAWWLANRPSGGSTTPTVDTDTDTRSTLRPYKG